MTIEMTSKLRKRFCKDMNIPIAIYDEPYFTHRLVLLDEFYNSVSKYKIFIDTLSKYENENEFFDSYNLIKDNIIDHLKDKLIEFNNEDMDKFVVVNTGFTSKSIFNAINIDREFLSIDMVKANFTALKYYDENIFPDSKTYKEFVSKFTKDNYFISSKYIRQVVFGNQNPKRQTTYEKYLMDGVLTEILDLVDKQYISCFTNDEVILDITDINNNLQKEALISEIEGILDDKEDKGVKLKLEHFKLEDVLNGKGYKKVFYNGDVIQFKCLNSIEIPFAIREYNNEEVKEEDKVFLYENELAKFI